jgi:hypothetical protein
MRGFFISRFFSLVDYYYAVLKRNYLNENRFDN